MTDSVQDFWRAQEAATAGKAQRSDGADQAKPKGLRRLSASTIVDEDDGAGVGGNDHLLQQFEITKGRHVLPEFIGAVIHLDAAIIEPSVDGPAVGEPQQLLDLVLR